MPRRPPPDDNQLLFPVDDFLPKAPEPSDLPAGDDFDPGDLVDRLMASNLDASFVEVDEFNDLPRAANVVEWILDPRFSNADPEPFPKTLEVLVSLFEDFCPSCSDKDLVRLESIQTKDVFGSVRAATRHDVRFPTDIAVGELLDRVQTLEFGVCPKCGTTRQELQRRGLFHNPQELVIVAGQRSTKTTTAAYAWSYLLHRFLCIPNPARRYGLPRGQFFETFFTAITAEQAYKTLWKQAEMVYDNAPWFAQCARLLTQKGKEKGVQYYRRGTTFIAFPGKNIACYYGPPEGHSQRGRTRILGAVSEWGWFARGNVDGKKVTVTANADDIYSALSRSLFTVRAGCDTLRNEGWFDAPNALMLNEGSPYSIQDKGMRLLRGLEHNPKAVVRHYSTFEFNPKVKPEHAEVPLDSEEGRRDYLAIPPMASGAFIEDPKAVYAAIDIQRPQGISYRIDQVVDKVPGTENLTAYVCAKLLMMPPDKYTPRVIGVDAGENYSSFAVVMIHVDKDLRTIVDGAIEVIPDGDRPVHFPTMLDDVLLRGLGEHLNIRYIVWDRWQSIEASQRARLQGINAQRYSLKMRDFEDFKGRFLSGRVRLPAPEADLKKVAEQDPKRFEPFPVARLCVQTMTVRRVGQKLEKPLNGKDDLFRALVLADTIAEPVRASLVTEVDAHGIPIPQIVGAVIGMSDRHAVGAAMGALSARRSRIGATAGLSDRGRGPVPGQAGWPFNRFNR